MKAYPRLWSIGLYTVAVVIGVAGVMDGERPEAVRWAFAAALLLMAVAGGRQAYRHLANGRSGSSEV